MCFIGTRGITAQIVVLEEAAHTPARLVREVVIPLFGVVNFTLLAIATPGEGMSNHYTRLMDMRKPDGQLLFKTIRIALCCSECISKFKDGEVCPHRDDLIPPWKSSERLKVIQRILDDDPDLNARENLGLLTDGHQFFVSRDLLQRMLNLPRPRFSGCPAPFVFIGIDPSGGGAQSTFAMASVAVLPNGHAAVRASQPQIHTAQLVHELLAALVRHPRLRTGGHPAPSSRWRRGGRVQGCALEPHVKLLL